MTQTHKMTTGINVCVSCRSFNMNEKKKIWMLTIRSAYKYYGSAKTDLNWNYAFSHSFGAIYGFSIDFGSLHIFVVGVFSSSSRVHCWLKRLTRFVCYFKIMSQDPFNSVFIVYGFLFFSLQVDDPTILHLN